VVLFVQQGLGVPTTIFLILLLRSLVVPFLTLLRAHNSAAFADDYKNLLGRTVVATHHDTDGLAGAAPILSLASRQEQLQQRRLPGENKDVVNKTTIMEDKEYQRQCGKMSSLFEVEEATILLFFDQTTNTTTSLLSASLYQDH
jgi:hypothetical protein